MMTEQNATRVGKQVRNPTRNQKKPANDDGTETHKSRETNPRTLPGTRRNQQMMKKQKSIRIGRQVRNPTRNRGRQVRNPTRNREMMMEQSLFLGRIENPIQLQSCLGKNQQMMTKQKPIRVGRQVRNPTRNQKEPGHDDGIECHKSRETRPEPYPQPEGTSK